MEERKELLEKLKKLSHDGGDQEINHIKADDLLLKYIDDIEITTAFNSIDRWYE